MKVIKIDWKSRVKNVSFWVGLVIAVFTPILMYFGLKVESLTTWAMLFETLKNAISNPYVVIMVIGSVYNAVVNPTTEGIGD